MEGKATVESLELNAFNLKNIEFDKDGHAIENRGDLGKFAICLRPGTKTKYPVINAKIINQNKQILVNDYGHAGYGYSTNYGSVFYSYKFLTELIAKENFEFNKEKDSVYIIGLGVIGLTTAIYLHENGFRNITIVGEKTIDIPSSQCGALIEMVNPLEDEIINCQFPNIFEKTFLEYEKIEKGKSHFLNRAVKKIDFYVEELTEHGLFVLSKKGIIPPPKIVNVKMKGSKLSPKLYYRLVSYLADPVDFINLMSNKAKELGINVIQGKFVESFSEIEEKHKIIFNCAGLGGFKLNNDRENEHPICGHTFLLNSEKTDDGNYVFVVSKLPGVEMKSKWGIYFMPRNQRMIGGTFIEGYYGDNQELNKKELTDLVTRSYYFIHGEKPKF